MSQTSATSVPAASSPLEVVRKDGKIWSHVRKRWLVETPEERVRQEFLVRLVNEYGYQLEQISEELEVTGRGSGQARADFVVWRSVADRREGKSPFIVVECKSDNVTISEVDYAQGDNYARLTGAQFLVTHNNQETRFWRVRHGHMPKSLDEVSDIPTAGDSDEEVQRLISELRVFRENEFADLLQKCHNIIRNREKLDPVAAFDEIAKILFVKVTLERRLKKRQLRNNLFTAEFLDQQAIAYANPVETLFNETKSEYRDEGIFGEDEAINLRLTTVRAIVKELEKYDLSETSEDIKGIAFEKFLGETFRGEIGQFFTPRPIVEFMIRMVDPDEGEVICDPACGSGGFLIRFFEIVRQEILSDADREYQAYRSEVEARGDLSEEEKAELLRERYSKVQEALDPRVRGSRLWDLANNRIYGVDANERMARTCKMNMIMHGDGHGGVHHGDGLVDINGIFDGRFDIILTNPPFGASVEPTDVIHAPPLDESTLSRYKERYGPEYAASRAQLEAAHNQPVASQFELTGGKSGQQTADRAKVKTEILFLERSIGLLKPGGRLGIVLPESIFNNPSLDYVREFCESRGFLKAIVSLPQKTFYSSGATVKTSLLFFRKFTEEEVAAYEQTKKEAHQKSVSEVTSKAEMRSQELEDHLDTLAEQIKSLRAQLRKLGRDPDASEEEIAKLEGELASFVEERKTTQGAKKLHERTVSQLVEQRAKELLKAEWDYPVFLYNAEHVGITATGELDTNELYFDEAYGLPEGVTPDTTALELFQRFLEDPDAISDLGTSDGE